MSAEMKPPTPEAVERALAILIQSINKENGKCFASRPSEQRLDQTLAQLEQNDLVLQVACKSISVGIKTWAASLRKSRNAFLPIGKIPVELIVEILLSSLRVNDRPGVKRLQQLASVSTRWWDLILSFPRFWTTIKLDHNVALKLRRSGQMPLTIALHPQWDHIEEERIATITAIREHLNRCQNLQLSGEVEYFISQLQTVETPLLKKVDCNGGDPEDPIFIDLPSVNIVHSLRLKATVMIWSALAGLRNLHISDIDLPYLVPSAPDLVHILRSSPALEVLELEDLQGGFESLDHDRYEAGKETEQIELPKLNRLIMRRIRLERSTPILSIIRAKSLLDFQLVETTNVDGGICTKECQSLIRTVIENGSIKRIVISVTETHVEMKNGGPGVGHARLHLDHAHRYLQTVYRLGRSIPESVDIDLRISISLVYPGPAQWEIIDSIIDHLPGIDSLSLTMHPKMINQLVEKLSNPRYSAVRNATGVEWPAQRLSRLRVTKSPRMGIDFSIIENGLVALLESRTQATDITLPELKVSDEAGYSLVVIGGEVDWIRKLSY